MIDGCESCDTEEGAERFDPIGRHMRAKLQMAALDATPQRLALCSLLFMASDRHVTAEMLSREASAMCEFRFNPATDSDLKPAVLPI
ncbi:hypothetical protein [Rhodoblastus sp.]|jgi:hypothetical protein|uniref:hypothetical protein n=1 Tax=Rhodoblastus sp. TaxID=1962975 RepID=UPI0025E89282|nr:hypothetical protein [Rhodoblastus sp.]